jgi:hypothetical protein
MRTRSLFIVVAILIGLAGFAPSADAQDNVGGHIGFVIPWVTHAGGQTTTISDRFTIGFPIGVTFKGPAGANLDLEMVPSIAKAQDTAPQQVNLTVDPGLVWSLTGDIGAGVRLAFDVGSSQFGFIPLVNKSWKLADQSGLFKAFFVEVDLPIKFNRQGGSGAADTNPVTFATHVGVGF